MRAKESAAQVKEHLRGFLDPRDGITVVEAGGPPGRRAATLTTKADRRLDNIVHGDDLLQHNVMLPLVAKVVNVQDRIAL